MDSEAARAQAREDFDQARKEAALQDILSGIRRKSSQLIPFDDIQARFIALPDAKEEARSIPLDAVIGSVGRYNDFNRDFLPRNQSDSERWTSVKRARDANIDLPPIRVYRIGEIYFVIDGNHRVSVAKRRGETEIRASVIEIPTRVALTSEDSVEDVVRKAALNAFLEATRLDEYTDQSGFLATEPGAYTVLLQQIEMVHFRAQEQAGGEVAFSEAARIWCDDHYLPVAAIIREQNLLKHYPDRTETDLYVWLLENHQALVDEIGWGVHLETIAADLAEQKRTGGRLRRILRTAADPESETGAWRDRQLSMPKGRMFSDLLVVLDRDDPTGPALRQALRIAEAEEAHLLGLWIDEAGGRDEERLPGLQRIYEQHCAEAQVFGQLARGRGERSELVRARARWADLLVLQSSRGRAPSRALQQVLAGVFIPVWVARREEKPSSRVLLAYDGSPKADEALFLTAYMGALWGSDISVLTVAEPGAPENVQDRAREYLDSFNIPARYLSARPPVPEAILAAADGENAGLLATGSVHTNRLGRATLGPTLDRLLTDSPVPLLICR